MKNLKNKNLSYFSIVNSFRDGVVSEPMVSLNNSFELLALARNIGWRVILACYDGPVKLTKRLKILYSFCSYILIMRKHHGETFTVKYLKSSQLALFKAIAGNPFKSLREIEPELPLPRLTTSGLPRFIPLEDRRAILSGSSSIIRYWGSLFALYRVIRIPGKLKLETITNPFSGDEFTLTRGITWLSAFAESQIFRFDKEILSKEFGFLPLETSSPSNRVSWRGFLYDVRCLYSLGLGGTLRNMLDTIGQSRLMIYSTFIQESKLILAKAFDGKAETYSSLGQLAIKEEAAGKLRVFALVDSWTQSSLKPLHEMLFKFLKSLPNDATFNQGLSVQRCMEKAKIAGCSFGYDLSAATDRLPIKLQVAILTPLIGELGAQCWKTLLIGRTYKLETPQYSEELSYAVGQPMGALSSWAMLAVTHHFIVQMAYRSCRTILSAKDWYSNYELLGDDIVIFDKDVAESYLNLMKGFGVDINQSKSVISNNSSFEFAKVFAKDGINLSPVSWKMFMSQNSNMGRVNIAFSLLNSRKIKSPITFIKNIVRKTTYSLGDYKFCLLALVSMLVKKNSLSYDEVLKLLIVPVEDWNRRIKSSVENLNIGFLELVISSLLKGENPPQRSSQLIADIKFNDEPWHKMALFHRLMKIKREIGSSENMRQVLTDKLVSALCPGEIPKHLCIVDYTNHQNLTGSDLEYSTWYTMFYSLADSLFGDSQWLDDIGKMVLLKTIDELIQLNEKADRLVEVSKLVERSEEKLDGKLKNRERVDSPLKSLSFILRSNKKRPLFTMTTSSVKLSK